MSEAADSEIKAVTPYLHMKNAAAAIDFYVRAFGASEQFRLTEPGGRVGHAQLLLGTTLLMLADEFPEMNILGPQSLGGSGTTLSLSVDNADAMAARAVAAGATLLSKPADQFYGERSCLLRDPFGHEWKLSHQIEELSPEEIQRRFEAMFG